MTVFTPIGKDQLPTIMTSMEESLRWPIFIHCAQGQDRTGYICAAYRVLVQGWTVEEAMEELQAYVLSPFGEMWHEITEAVKDLKK